MAYLMIVDDDQDFASEATKVLQNAGHGIKIEPKIEPALKIWRNEWISTF